MNEQRQEILSAIKLHARNDAHVVLNRDIHFEENETTEKVENDFNYCLDRFFVELFPPHPLAWLNGYTETQIIIYPIA